MTPPLTVLCIASFEKGQEFMRQCKREGHRTYLLTSKSLENADWPRENLDDIFYIPDVDKQWNMDDVIRGVSYLARTLPIDRIIALDDFDVEKAAALREHLRVPGMGDTTARYFRDKLAMRKRAEDENISVPRFSPIINYDALCAFLADVPPPYVLKPRSQAGAIGIQKIHSADEVWQALDALGDGQSYYLLEQFVAGDIYHVDTIVEEKKVLFSATSKYGKPPMEVSHEGRVFTTSIVPHNADAERTLKGLNKIVLKAFGLVRGVSHSEYIQGEDGRFYFLETSARVAGAHIPEMIEGATGINLWAEWAKLETSNEPGQYTVPATRSDYAGLMVSLAKQEWPDLSDYDDPEVVWRLNKKQHAGLVVASPSYERVQELLAAYTERFYEDFFASAPPSDRATN
jgi:biotin carboxylase